MDWDVEKIRVNAFSDLLLCHFQCDIKDVLTLKERRRGNVAHKQRFAHTSASECDVKTFVRKTTLRNLVEERQVKRDLVLFTMVEVVSCLCV